MPFAEVPSAVPFARSRTTTRSDPIESGLWGKSSTAVWVSRRMMDRHVRSGLGKLPRFLAEDPEVCWQVDTSSKRWRDMLDVLGVVSVWRTSTTEQITSFTGLPEVKVLYATGHLFAMGLLEHGTTLPAAMSRKVATTTALWRPGRDEAAWRRLRRLLTYAEQVSITGGTAVGSEHQFDRHNVITTELALRLSEYAGPAAVIGDAMCDIHVLLHGDGYPPLPMWTRLQPDLVLVRGDGLRIAVELTANLGPDIGAKVSRWAQVLSTHPTAASGLMVLFVVVGPTAATKAPVARIHRSVRRAIRTAVAEHPGAYTDPTVHRMAAVRWDTWFPGDGTVDVPALTGMRGWRATGASSAPALNLADLDDATGTPDSRWEPVDLLNPAQVPFSPNDPIGMLGVIENASMLRQSPTWLRGPNRPSVQDIVHARAGFVRPRVARPITGAVMPPTTLLPRLRT